MLCPNGDAADVVVDFPKTMKLFHGDTVERSITQTVPGGIYRVILGSSDVGRGGQIQDHEQWRAKLGDVTTGFSDDLPDDPLTDVVGHTTHLPGTITVPVGVTEVTVQHWSTEPGNVDDTNPANSVIPDYLCLIRVETTNTPPVLDPIGDQMVDELTELSFTASASDPDLPAQTLTFSLDAAAPAGATIDPATGMFTWTPTADQGPGEYPVTVRVSDDGAPNLADTETITINVVGQPPPPPLLCPNGDAADVVVDFPKTMKLFHGDTVERSITQTVPGGIYRVILGSSDVGRGGQIQDHEQWRAKLGDVTTGFSDDLPDDPLTDVVGHTTHLPGTITVPVGVTEVTVQHWSTEPGNVDDTNPANSVIPDYLCLIRVETTNTPPVLDPIGDQMVDELTELSFTASASDPDVPAQTLTFSATSIFPPTSSSSVWKGCSKASRREKVLVLIEVAASRSAADSESSKSPVTIMCEGVTVAALARRNREISLARISMSEVRVSKSSSENFAASCVSRRMMGTGPGTSVVCHSRAAVSSSRRFVSSWSDGRENRIVRTDLGFFSSTKISFAKRGVPCRIRNGSSLSIAPPA